MTTSSSSKNIISQLPNSISGDGKAFVATLKQTLSKLDTTATYAADNMQVAKTVEQVITLALSETHNTDSNGYPQNNIDVTFATTNVTDYKSAQVHVSTDNGVNYSQVGSTDGTAYVITGVTTGTTYKIKVVATDSEGNVADFTAAPTATITIAGSQLVPATPTQFVLTWDKDGPMWEWLHDANAYTDFYELRLDGLAGTYNDNLLDRTRLLYSRVNPGVRSGTAYLFVRNIFGDYSVAATHSFSKPVENKPAVPTITALLNGIRIDMDTIPATASVIHVYMTINTTTIEEFDIASNVFNYFRTTGTVTVKYCFVDTIGYGEYSDTATIILKEQIVSADITDNAITELKLASDAVTEAKIALNAVTAVKISDNAITAGKILAGAVVTDKLAANAVVAEKIATDAVTSDKIYAGSVTALKIATDAVTADKVLANAITSDKIATNAVTAAKIEANAVEADKIKAGAVTTDKIFAGAITAEKIATDAVTANAILAGSIIGDHISAGAITADKLAVGDIDLTGQLAIVGGAVKLDENGLKVTNATSGSYNLLNAEGMNFYDGNGSKFAGIGRYVSGTANHGQYVRFTNVWDKTPSVVVVPNILQTNVSSYNSYDVQIVCNAIDITTAGFTVQAYTVLKAGASGVIPINTTLLNDVQFNSGSKAYANYTYTTIPNTATTATIVVSVTLIASVRPKFDYIWYTTANADIELYVNDVLIASQYNIAGSGTYTSLSYTSTLSAGTFTAGATLRTRIAYWSPVRDGDNAHITTNIVQAQCNTTTDNVIATGSAAFICTDADNAQYSLE